MSQPQQNQKAVRNPEYDKATLGIWFPACQPNPLTGAEPFQRIEVSPQPPQLNPNPDYQSAPYQLSRWSMDKEGKERFWVENQPFPQEWHRPK